MLRPPCKYQFLVCTLCLVSCCSKCAHPTRNEILQDIEYINFPDTLYCKGKHKLAFPKDFPNISILLVRSNSACASCFNDLVNSSVMLNSANKIGNLFILLPNINPEQLEKISSFYPSSEYNILCPIIKDTVLNNIINHMLFLKRNNEKQHTIRSYSIVNKTDINAIFENMNSDFSNN